MPELRTIEAVELLPAVVLGVARDLGSRAVIIKGRTLSVQGLRSPRTSGDVDVWVAPEDFESFVAEMKARQWHDRDQKVLAPLTGPSSAFTVHSVTLQGPGWPIALDVHRCYPGFFAQPAHLFDEIWAEREFVELGGQWCAVPQTVDHWLLAMLHALRDRNLVQLEQLEEAARNMTPDDSARLRERAIVLGAVEPLRERFVSWGWDFPPPGSEEKRLLAEWKLAISDAPHGDFAHVSELVRSRGWRRIVVVWRAVFPPETTFRLFHEVGPGRWGLFRAYTRRWVGGVAAIPRMLSYARRMRQTNPGVRDAFSNERNPAGLDRQ